MLASTLVPRLTASGFSCVEMGEAVVRHVVDEITANRGAPPISGSVLLDCPLVVRNSVVPPAGR